MIRELIERLVNDGYAVFMLMRSYGGIVGSEAALDELSIKHRSQAGPKGGITRLAFMSACVMIPGEHIVEAQGYRSNSDSDARIANSRDMNAKYFQDGTCRLLIAAQTSSTLLTPE